MVRKPLVSVLMPVYNTEKYIAGAIQSMIDQTYTNLEILITDDCSTDDSGKIIDQFTDSRIRKFKNPTNLGYLKTCNNLFSLASGEFFAFQDADDWSDPTRIEFTMEKLLADNSIELCGCNYKRISARNKVTHTSHYPEKDEDIRVYMEINKSLPICGATVVLRKSVYEAIGGYREFFDRFGYEHIDWFFLASEKYKIANIAAPLYNYRYIRNSFSLSNQLVDYMKFNMIDIVWFLSVQRKEHGADALQDSSLQDDLNAYLKSLEKSFRSDRKSVYSRMVNRFSANMDYWEALSATYSGISKEEINPLFALYLLFITFKAFLRNLYIIYVKKYIKRT
jgi:glycosyltransferase involved in cell wall biosynthesis